MTPVNGRTLSDDMRAMTWNNGGAVSSSSVVFIGVTVKKLKAFHCSGLVSLEVRRYGV
jgi:hypothetical protein